MIAQEIYDARVRLEKEFPSLDVRVVRSGSRYRNYVVGVRPKHVIDDLHIWIWTPIDEFPDDELRLKLSLVA